jgi:hypothetical protein
MKRIFLALLSCLLCACSDIPRLSENPETARQQIANLVPLGTSRDDAVKILTKFGFKCSFQTGQYGEETFKEYISGYYRVSAGWVDDDIWSIAVILKDGQLADYRLNYHKESL